MGTVIIYFLRDGVFLSTRRFYSLAEILEFSGYIRDGYNIFDGILVVISLFDVAVETITGDSSGASA